MTYQCVNCGVIWVKGEATKDVSHGSCPGCFRDRVRKLQIIKGYYPCYGTATAVCSRSECRFHAPCNVGIREE